MKGRQKFRCSVCGLRLAGVQRGAVIVASDRAPAKGAEIPCLCLTCAGTILTAVAKGSQGRRR